MTLKNEQITGFDQLLTRLKQGGARKTVAVVWPDDASTRQACLQAMQQGWARFVLVGGQNLTHDEAFAPFAQLFECLPAETPAQAAAQAVQLVRQGRAQVLMKGLVGSDVVLRAVLNRQQGLLPPGRVLTHVAIASIPAHSKLLLFTDAAVIPAPTQEQRVEQVRSVAQVSRALGTPCPRVSLVHCSEKVDERHFPFTAGYAAIKQQAAQGEFGPCVVDGPLDVKTSCSPQAMRVKGINSPIDGQADALVFPDIEAANAFYKAITLFAGATTAGLLCGPSAPVVLPSRGDSPQSKLHSLATAILL